MAERWWVGGNNTWNTTATGKWSTYQGGPPGASVPTSADDVYLINAGTVTIGSTVSCKSLTIDGGTTIAGTFGINVYGNFIVYYYSSWTNTANINLYGNASTASTLYIFVNNDLSPFNSTITLVSNTYVIDGSYTRMHKRFTQSGGTLTITNDGCLSCDNYYSISGTKTLNFGNGDWNRIELNGWNSTVSSTLFYNSSTTTVTGNSRIVFYPQKATSSSSAIIYTYRNTVNAPLNVFVDAIFYGAGVNYKFNIYSSSYIRDLTFEYNYAGSWYTASTITTYVYGNISVSNGPWPMTLSSTAVETLYIQGTGEQTIWTNGIALDKSIYITNNATLRLDQDLTLNSLSTLTTTTTLLWGKLKLQDYALKTNIFNSSTTTYARTVDIGSEWGTIEVRYAGTAMNIAPANFIKYGTVNNHGYIRVAQPLTGTTNTSINSGLLPEADSFNLYFVSGVTQSVALPYGNSLCNLDFTGYNGAWTGTSGGNLTLYGDLTYSTTMTVNTSSVPVEFKKTGTQYLNQAGFTGVKRPWIINNSATTVALSENYNQVTLSSTIVGGTVTQGTLNLNGCAYIIDSGYFNSSGTLSRAILHGWDWWGTWGYVKLRSGRWDCPDSTNLTVIQPEDGGRTQLHVDLTGSFYIYHASTTNGGINTLIDLYMTYSYGNYALYFNESVVYHVVSGENLTFGYGSILSGNLKIWGDANFSNSTWSTYSGSTGEITLARPSGTQWLTAGFGPPTTTGLGFLRVLNIDGSSDTVVKLTGDTYIGNKLSLVRGTLDLNGATLYLTNTSSSASTTTGFFSDNANTRRIKSGNIVTGRNWNCATTTGMTVDSDVTLMPTNYTQGGYNLTPTIYHGSTTWGGETSDINFYVEPGYSPYSFVVAAGTHFKDFIYYYNTTVTPTLTNSMFTSRNFYIGGEATQAAAIVFNVQFVGTGTSTILGDQVLKGSFNVSKTGTAKVQFANDVQFSLDNSTYLRLTSGTLSVTGHTVTTPCFESSGTATRALELTAGVLVCSPFSGMTTPNAVNVPDGTGFTWTATTGYISVYVPSGSTANFVGGGGSYPRVNFTNSSDATLYITGNNTFYGLTNTGYNGSAPQTFKFAAGSTTTVANTFNVTGVSGALVNLLSDTAGTQWYITKATGTVTASYLNIQDSNASGNVVWQAGYTSTDAGNNNGWYFGPSPTPTGQPTGMFIIFC